MDTGLAGSSFSASGSFTVTVEVPRNVAFTREAGGFRVVWRGTPGGVYRVEASEDLVSWTPLTTRPAAGGTGLFDYLDVPSAAVSKRFYRAARP